MEVCEQIIVNLDAVLGSFIFFHTKFFFIVILSNQIKMDGREKVLMSVFIPLVKAFYCHSE